MGAKKKKKSKKKKEKKEGDEEEEKKEEDPAFTVNLPEYGWIRVELRLCDAPNPNFNKFRVIMRSDERVLELKKHIIDYHGRVENVHLYNKDPYPVRDPKKIEQRHKKRVPPFRLLSKLKELTAEKEAKDAENEKKRKKQEEEGYESEEVVEANPYAVKEDPTRFDILKSYDITPDDFGVE